MSVVDCQLYQVGKMCSAINGRTVVVAAKLEGVKKGESVEVGHEASSDNFLKKLAIYLEKCNGALGFGLSIV